MAKAPSDSVAGVSGNTAAVQATNDDATASKLCVTYFALKNLSISSAV